MNINDGFIEFCPDVGGICVGSVCAACKRGINFGTKDASPIVNKVGHILDEPTPLFMFIDVPFCSKYNKLIGEEAAALYYELLSDVGQLPPQIEEL